MLQPECCRAGISAETYCLPPAPLRQRSRRLTQPSPAKPDNSPAMLAGSGIPRLELGLRSNVKAGSGPAVVSIVSSAGDGPGLVGVNNTEKSMVPPAGISSPTYKPTTPNSPG